MENASQLNTQQSLYGILRVCLPTTMFVHLKSFRMSSKPHESITIIIIMMMIIWLLCIHNLWYCFLLIYPLTKSEAPCRVCRTDDNRNSIRLSFLYRLTLQNRLTYLQNRNILAGSRRRRVTVKAPSFLLLHICSFPTMARFTHLRRWPSKIKEWRIK